MGTSNANGGQGDDTPLVPSWLPPEGAPAPPPPPIPPPDQIPPDLPPDGGPGIPPAIPAPPSLPPIPVSGAADRFRTARANFTRFAKSGGSDRASLGRALSGYVSTSSGGRRAAAQRMGSARVAGVQLLGVLSSAVASGARETLRALNLERLAGRPIEEVFLGLMDYVCPFDGGTVDEGIARDAFVETIADLAENGIIDFDSLTFDQMQIVFELYATHAIETRICNDIGMKAVTVPVDAAAAASVQRQLLDFIRRSVSDSLTQAHEALQTLTPDNINRIVTGIYEQAFGILQTIAEAEAEE
jgi:hypothetical protein